MIRALIVDDEAIARRHLSSLLAREADLDVVGECRDGPEAVDMIRRLRPELLFLDIQMPGLNGFQVLEQLQPEERPAVIFVTAHDDYAVRAFRVHALDYLLKPFDSQRLHETLQRAREEMLRSGSVDRAGRLQGLIQENAARSRPLERLAVNLGEETLILRVDEIHWIEASANYVLLHAGSRSFPLRRTLGSMEEGLDPYRFVRVHRSAIVNVDRIARLVPWSHGDMKITLEDGTELNLSRRYRKRLERLVDRLGS